MTISPTAIAEQPSPTRSPSLWWDRARVAAHRVSPFLTEVLNDGRYVLAWPAGANVPGALLVAGLILGWVRPWPLFSYSLAGMAIMTAFAMAGAAFGAWLWLGYVVGDFVFAAHPPVLSYGSVAARFLHVRVPLVIAYAVFAFALLFVPLASKYFRARVWASAGPHAERRGVHEALAAVPAAALIFSWTLVAPLLIRPAVTWDHPGVGRFSKYPIEAFRPLQHWGWVLALVAAAAAAGRVRLERMARLQNTYKASVKPRLIVVPRPRLTARLPVYALIPLQAAALTFFCSGLTTSWTEALILFGIFVLVIIVRRVASRTPALADATKRVPLAARVAASAAISFLIGCLIMRGAIARAPGFRALIYALGASLLVSAVLVPPADAPGQKA
jgi:hypothetical protein